MNDRALSRWSSDEPSPAEVVAALNGKPIWGPRRAVDMQIFDFGEGVPIVDRNGRDRMIGEYRLHIQSDWRFVRKGVAFVTYEDLWLPTTDAPDAPFDPEGGALYIRETLKVIDSLETSEAERQKIYQGNAERLFDRRF